MLISPLSDLVSLAWLGCSSVGPPSGAGERRRTNISSSSSSSKRRNEMPNSLSPDLVSTFLRKRKSPHSWHNLIHSPEGGEEMWVDQLFASSLTGKSQNCTTPSPRLQRLSTQFRSGFFSLEYINFKVDFLLQSRTDCCCCWPDYALRLRQKISRPR